MTLSLTESAPGIVAHALQALVSQIPSSTEKPALLPGARAQTLARTAALKAAALSGTFTLPPGPFGLATVLPDLLAVWRVQQQLVADIAAAYGRTESLTRETMLLCLFKHGGAALTQRLLSRGRDDDVVVHRIANRALQQLLEKIAVRVAQRIAAKSVSRWLPLVGAVGAGAYAYYDTSHVATNALELFSRPLQLVSGEPVEDAAANPSPESTPRRAHTRAKPRGRAASSAPRKRRPKSAGKSSKPAS